MGQKGKRNHEHGTWQSNIRPNTLHSELAKKLRLD